MRRLAVLALLGPLACSADRGGEEPSREPTKHEHESSKSEPNESEPTESEPTEALPDHMANQVVTIAAAQARAKGLPPLGFSLDFTGTAFTVSPFVEGSYLYASGPPGGPLGLRVSPVARDAAFAGVVGGSNVERQLVTEQIELLGASRPAVAWISGESMARTSWCAFILAPESGDDALLFELGVGHQGDAITCKTALGQAELAKVIASAKFL
ncbi:hypothetical protein ACNOYE_19965 [Nannocystaceae bacterium ST9]